MRISHIKRVMMELDRLLLATSLVLVLGVLLAFALPGHA